MTITLSPATELRQLHLDTSWPSPSMARVSVLGEVDLATSHLLRDQLLGMLREQTPTVVEVDLAGVTFLDCTGLSALVAARNATVRAGGQLRVSNPEPIVRRVLDLTGLLDVLAVPIDQSAALARQIQTPIQGA